MCEYDAKVLTQKDDFDINLDISSSFESMLWGEDDTNRMVL